MVPRELRVSVARVSPTGTGYMSDCTWYTKIAFTSKNKYSIIHQQQDGGSEDANADEEVKTKETNESREQFLAADAASSSSVHTIHEAPIPPL